MGSSESVQKNDIDSSGSEEGGDRPRELGFRESALLKNYIDSRGDDDDDRDRLRELLKDESVDTRYELLMNVRGWRRSRLAGTQSGAIADDLESIKYMLEGFSSNQKYDVVKIQSSGECTALHYAAFKGYTSIINYLLSNLSYQQKYDLLKIQNDDGNTALHAAAITKRVETVQAIVSSVSSPLLIQLLNIKNKKAQTVTDIRPELHDELSALANKSRSTKLH